MTFNDVIVATSYSFKNVFQRFKPQVSMFNTNKVLVTTV